VLDVSRPRPCKHSYHLGRFGVARLVVEAIVVVPATPVHVAAPHVIEHSLDAVVQSLVGFAPHVHILDVPALAFRFWKANIELLAIVIGFIGFIVVVHPVDF